ncbi:MAG: GAF domain-containing protein [Chthoniobacter sp.]|uniref:GAF domain-containing protein n=1 Tax=Chthoniobacter sp. TaxID=2510640 RepID=UPI0032A7472D
MGERLTVLNDDRLGHLRTIVRTRLRELAGRVGTGSFDEFFDSTMRALVVDCFQAIGAHEGTVWLLEESRNYLIPRFNTGPNAASFVGRFRQSVRAGMISMIVSTELPLCENDVSKNQQQDKSLDQKLGLQTCAMLATPLYFAGELRGVISAVQLRSPNSADPEPPGFSPRHLETLQLTATVFARLIEQQLLSLAIGLEELT